MLGHFMFSSWVIISSTSIIILQHLSYPIWHRARTELTRLKWKLTTAQTRTREHETQRLFGPHEAAGYQKHLTSISESRYPLTQEEKWTIHIFTYGSFLKMLGFDMSIDVWQST